MPLFVAAAPAINRLQKDIDFDQRLCGDMQLLLTSTRDILFAAADGRPGIISVVSTIVMATALIMNSKSGWLLLTLCYAYNIVIIIFSRVVTIPIVPAAADRARCEGDFRYLHSRVREFAESIAFFQGEKQRRTRKHQLRVATQHARSEAWRRASPRELRRSQSLCRRDVCACVVLLFSVPLSF